MQPLTANPTVNTKVSDTYRWMSICFRYTHLSSALSLTLSLSSSLSLCRLLLFAGYFSLSLSLSLSLAYKPRWMCILLFIRAAIQSLPCLSLSLSLSPSLSLSLSLFRSACLWNYRPIFCLFQGDIGAKWKTDTTCFEILFAAFSVSFLFRSVCLSICPSFRRSIRNCLDCLQFGFFRERLQWYVSKAVSLFFDQFLVNLSDEISGKTPSEPFNPLNPLY